MTSPFASLPAVLRARVGALDAGWTDEPRATCDACPLVTTGAPYPFSMAHDVRCCSAQPDLANFLVGRALRDPASAAVIARRLANPDGVSTWGIRAVAGFDAAFPARAAAGFGRDVALRCPFWVGGDHSCGVWAARSARCRGYFCRHERGLTGATAWAHGAGLSVALEAALAAHLVDALPPAPSLEAWFARCADAADAITAADALAIVARVPPAVPVDDAATATRIEDSPRGRAVTRLRMLAPTLAECIVPAVSGVARVGDDVLIAGYSAFDAIRCPPGIFALLARLDGRTPWRDALAEARALDPGLDPRLDEALVRELVRVGALREPTPTDEPPPVTSM